MKDIKVVTGVTLSVDEGLWVAVEVFRCLVALDAAAQGNFVRTGTLAYTFSKHRQEWKIDAQAWGATDMWTDVLLCRESLRLT